MRTLLIVAHNDQGQLYDCLILCPFCFQFINEIDTDAYVTENCSIHCDNCQDLFLCPTCEKSPKFEQSINCFERIFNCEKETGCTKKLDRINAINIYGQIVDSMDKKVIDKGQNISLDYYDVAILNLTHLMGSNATNHPHEELDLNEIMQLKTNDFVQTNVMRTIDAPHEVDLSHDGSQLFYKGICSECQTHYTGSISGD
jgi:hypothetical protein